MLRRGRHRQPQARLLAAADTSRAEALLEQHPLETVFLRSEIRQGALRQGALLGVERPDHSLGGVLMQGALVVPWAPDPRDLATLAAALRPQAGWVQLIVGPQAQVTELQTLLQPWLPPVRLLRAEQPHYAVDGATLAPLEGGIAPVRRARVEELDQMAEVGAAMHLGEVGFDPLLVDPAGWRERVLTLIRRGRMYVWMEDGRVAFKADCASVTAEAVQLQGVWTDPALRGQGRATRGLLALCQLLLRETQAVTLFVNDFNDVAIRLYERTGFRRIGSMRTVLF